MKYFAVDEVRSWFMPPKIIPVSLVTDKSCSSGFDAEAALDMLSNDLSLQALIHKLTAVNSTGLRSIEWMHLFGMDEEFNELSSSEQTVASTLIWKHLFRAPLILGLSLRRIAELYDSKAGRFPAVVAASLSTQATTALSTIDQLRVAWITALQQENFTECARLSLRNNLLPSDLLNRIGFPNQPEYLDQVLRSAALAMPNYAEVKDEIWWLTCQDEIPASQTIEQLDQLLTRLKQVKAGGKLDHWIREYCLPESKNTLWFRLNPPAKKSLRLFYNVSSFDYVKLVFKALRGTAKDTSLSERESNSLQRRIDFWSDYSDRFHQVRFLLPTRSCKLLESHFNLNESRYVRMHDSHSNNSEACIFEFDSWIVVETFRGIGSQARFYRKNHSFSDMLLNSASISLAVIKNEPCDKIHDHAYLWQYYCEKMLRKELGIKPNKDSKLNNQRTPSANAIEQRRSQIKR
ncbi:MAG: EH signature domain-containing protein [Motiliproteus sp.]